MSQEIKIPVSAQVDSRGLDKLDDAVSGVGDAVRGVASEARDAAAALGEMEAAARRLASTKAMLSRELGRPISDADASTFQSNFDSMRRGRGIGASRLRAFNDSESWYRGHSQTFTKEAHAAAHRRFIIARGMQGTADSEANGAPPPNAPPSAGGAGGGRAGGGGALGAAAWGFAGKAGMIGLGLAGVGSVVGMARTGMTNATSEANSIDVLKRRMGDLGVDFSNLREQARQAGAGLGVTYVESARLALEFGKEAGRLRAGDMGGMAIRNELRGGIGLSRSYGMDPAVGVQFMGSMRRLGVTQDDQGSRRLALLIADAIEKGGFIGKAEEVLQAVSHYATQAAAFTLSTPNVSAYLASMASLMGTGSPGLDPAGAASLLGAADGTMRRGGGRGEASMNFNYAAMTAGRAGMNPVTAKAMMEGGLFGTSTSEFYDPRSPLARFYAKNGLSRPGASDETNFDKMIPLLRKNYGNGEYLLDAVKNHFGLSSYGQSAALLEMQDRGVLGKSAALLQNNRIPLNNISASGLQSIAQIANATGPGDLRAAYTGIMGRKDIKEAEKRTLASAAQSAAARGDFGAMQSALVAAVASTDQEKDLATETRDATKAIQDALTKAGSPILAALNPMRIALEVLAKTIAPGHYAIAMAQADAAEKAANNTRISGAASRTPISWGNLSGVGPSGPASGREVSAMKYFMGKGWTKAQAAGIVGNLWRESAGLNPRSVNPKSGALGLAQWLGSRQAAYAGYARSKGKPLGDYQTQLEFVQRELDENIYGSADQLRKATNATAAAAAIAGFERAEGWSPSNPTGIDGWSVRSGVAQRLNDTPLPAAATSHQFNGTGPRLEFADAHVVLHEPSGKVRGKVTLKPITKPVPAGNGRTHGAPGVHH